MVRRCSIPRFFANAPSENDHPLITLMKKQVVLPSSQTLLLLKSLAPLFLTASADVLDGRNPADMKRSPWQYALENKLEPWLDLMREPMAFSPYSANLAPTILIRLSKSLLMEKECHSKWPLIAMEQMPLIPSIIYPLLEFFERHCGHETILGLARIIFQKWSKTLLLETLRSPTNLILAGMKERIERIYQQIRGNKCTTTLRLSKTPIHRLQRMLLDPYTDPIPYDHFKADLEKLSSSSQEFLLYDSIRLLSQCEPGFWCFNREKMNLLSRFYMLIFEQPAIDLTLSFQDKSNYLAAIIGMHSALASLLSAALVAMFNKGESQPKLAGFVRELYESAMAHNNLFAIRYITEFDACKNQFTAAVLTDRLKATWCAHPYHLDIVYYFLSRIAHLEPALFQRLINDDIFNDQAYQDAYLRIAFQYLFDQVQLGDIADIEVAFFNWHFSRLLPFMSQPVLTQFWNLAQTHFAERFVVNENAFIDLLTKFADQPLFSDEPYMLLYKAEFLIEKGVLLKLTIDDLDLCDRLIKVADIMPSKRVDIEALAKRFLPLVQAAKIEALNDTIADIRHEMFGINSRLTDVMKVSETRKKQLLQQKKDNAALLTENQALKIELAKSELARSMDKVFSDFTVFEGKIDHRAASIGKRLSGVGDLARLLTASRKLQVKAVSIDASSATAESEGSPLPIEVSVPTMVDVAVQVKRSSASKRQLQKVSSERDALNALAFRQKCQLEFLDQFSPKRKEEAGRLAFLEGECQRLSACCFSLNASNQLMASQLGLMPVMPPGPPLPMSAPPVLPFHQKGLRVKKPLKITKPAGEPS